MIGYSSMLLLPEVKTMSVAALIAEKLLDDQFTEVFLPDSEKQILTLRPELGAKRGSRRQQQRQMVQEATCFEAIIFDFETLKTELVMLHIDQPLEVFG